MLSGPGIVAKVRCVEGGAASGKFMDPSDSMVKTKAKNLDSTSAFSLSLAVRSVPLFVISTSG